MYTAHEARRHIRVVGAQVLARATPSGRFYRLDSSRGEVEPSPAKALDIVRTGAVLVLPTTGQVRLETAGKSLVLDDGDYLLLDGATRMVLELGAASGALVVGLPGHGPSVPATAAMSEVRRSGTAASATMIVFLRRMARLMLDCDPVLFEKLAAVVTRLVTIAESGATPPVGPRSQSADRTLARIKTSVLDNLELTSLSVREVATRNGVSVRYLHSLFHRDGISFARWMWRQRLEACRTKIAAAEFADQTIGDIAIEFGFSNFSHFSRCFKKTFGVTARDLRRTTPAASIEHLA